MKSVHQILVEARNLLHRDGWIQEELGPECGPNCAGGALYRAAGGIWTGDTDFKLVTAAADALVASGSLPIPSKDRRPWLAMVEWNNAKKRTKQEVLALFDKAIVDTAPTPDLSFLNDRIAERDQNAVFFGPIFEEAKS